MGLNKEIQADLMKNVMGLSLRTLIRVCQGNISQYFVSQHIFQESDKSVDLKNGLIDKLEHKTEAMADILQKLDTKLVGRIISSF